jgi:HK97 family phage major capsid protein
MPPRPPYDYTGVIPPEFSTQIIEEAVQQSAVLQLANLVPMGTSVTQMPIPKTLPKAAWVSAPGGRKPYTDLALEAQTLTAEEVAAVTAIPDVFLEDSSINLWNWVRPRLAEAIAVALDEAVLYGTGAPATFPAPGAGGLSSNTYSTEVIADANTVDAVDAVNESMGRVERQGLAVTGHAADLVVKGVFRGVRDYNGALLMGTDQVASGQRQTLYGLPIAYNPLPMPATGTPAEFFTGAWPYLIIGVRSDIRYMMDPSAVIADNAGAVVISGFQDNVTPLKVWARFAAQIVKPVTVRQPNGAIPFARSRFSGRFPSRPVAPAPPADADARSAKK